MEKLSSDCFSKEILPRRGHHFVRLTGKWNFRDLGSGSSNYIADIVCALPRLPNLKQLYTPDLVQFAQADRQERTRRAAMGIFTDDALRPYRLELEAQEEAILGLVQRAQSIMHPEMTPTGLLALFTHISGANLKALGFTSPNDRSQAIDLAAILHHFPNLESLKIHLDVLDERSALNPILDHDPTVGLDPAPQPHLRKLVLIGAYDNARFGDEVCTDSPSSAAFIRLAYRFAETLQVLVSDIDTYNYDIGDDEFSLEDHVDDETKFKFDRPFPVLRRLLLKGCGRLFLDLLLSLTTETLRKIESCLCNLGPDDNFGNLSDALAVAASRLPVLEVAQTPSENELMSRRLVEWVLHQIPAQPGNPTPHPLYHPFRNPDPTDQTARIQLTVEHLNKWFRTAREAQDPNALAQIQAALEGVDVHRTLLEAWAGPTVSNGKPENE